MNDTLRVGMVTARALPFMGGIETHVHEVSWRLAALGVDVTVLTTDTTGGRFNRNGATSAIQLTKTLPNGTIFGNFTSTVNQNGTRSILSFGRTLQLPSGTFSGTLGVTHTPAGNDRISGSLAYNHVMRSSDITVTAQRSVTMTTRPNQNAALATSSMTVGPAGSTRFSMRRWGRPSEMP